MSISIENLAVDPFGFTTTTSPTYTTTSVAVSKLATVFLSFVLLLPIIRSY